MKTLGALALCALLAAAPPTLASDTASTATSTDSELLEVESSGVHGDVTLVDLAAGKTLAVVNVAGLTPETDYILVRAVTGSCDIESYDESDIIATVTANSSGRATATEELEGGIDGIRTVSVWTTEDALVACCVSTLETDQ